MSAKHTPGPWGVLQDPHSGAWMIRAQTHSFGPPMRTVSRVSLHDHGTPEEREANARVIAEAPAMLESVSVMVEALSEGLMLGGWSGIWMDEARALLARIDGAT